MMQVLWVSGYQELSELVAEHIYRSIEEKPEANWGLATGSSFVGTYRLLVEKHRPRPLDLEGIRTFNLDEYVGLDGSSPYSFRYFMNRSLFYPLGLDLGQTNIPNGMAKDLELECKRYEEKIEASGGIDYQLLGVGVNGHIGFNEPGTEFSSRTHVARLTESTRRANSRFFGSIESVPTHAITMGIGSIMRAREIILVVSGDGKEEVVQQLLGHQVVSKRWPVTILKKHPKVTVIVDESLVSERVGVG